MAEKEAHLHLCIVCGMYGSRDAFTPGGSSTCKRCSFTTISDLDRRMRCLEINSQKNYGDLLKKGTGEDAWQVKRKSQGKPKMQKPDKEIATVAVEGRVTPDVVRQQKTKPEMEGRIWSAREAKQYFLIGVAKKDGKAEESLQKYELRTANLYDRAISDYKVKVIKVFHTSILRAINGYAVETKQLRDKYRYDPFCLNAKSGEDEFFREEGPGKGIAYLCVYCK